MVDDEHIIADTLAAILRLSGYEAAAVYDAHSALEHCDGGAPDVVITDVVMPGIGGLDLAIMLQQRYPHCKILLFSGQAATADILQDVKGRGYNFEVLAKPVHPHDLLSRLSIPNESVCQ